LGTGDETEPRPRKAQSRARAALNSRHEISVSKSRSRDAVLERLGLDKIWESLGLGLDRLEQNTDGLGLVSVSGLNVSFYKLCIFNDISSLNLVPVIG